MDSTLDKKYWKKTEKGCPYCGSLNHASVVWKGRTQYHRTCLDCHRGFNYNKNGNPTR